MTSRKIRLYLLAAAAAQNVKGVYRDLNIQNFGVTLRFPTCDIFLPLQVVKPELENSRRGNFGDRA